MKEIKKEEGRGHALFLCLPTPARLNTAASSWSRGALRTEAHGEPQCHNATFAGTRVADLDDSRITSAWLEWVDGEKSVRELSDWRFMCFQPNRVSRPTENHQAHIGSHLQVQESSGRRPEIHSRTLLSLWDNFRCRRALFCQGWSCLSAQTLMMYRSHSRPEA